MTESVTQVDFIVVGGGIGGLTAALALARIGRRVRVIEKAPVFEEIGAGLQLAPNAARVLDELGLLEAVWEDAFFPARLVLADAQSTEEIVAVPIDDAFVERFGYRYFVTHRADMHRVLVQACQADERISLRAGREIVAVEQHDGVVTALDATGEEHRAGALVGADGLWSRVRESVFGVAGAPVDSGYVAYRGTVPIETRTALDDDMVVWAGPGLHLVNYPVRRGALRNQVATLDTRAYPVAGQDDGTGAGGGAEIDIAAQLHLAFAGTAEQLRGGIAVMDTSRRWTLVDREPLENWAEGHVALLGDAAHPMLQYLAQGACQALEDAALLARCVDRWPEVAEALREYDALRRPRASRVQRNARRFGEIVHFGGMAAETRNAFLAHLDLPALELFDWLYAPGAETAEFARPVVAARPVTAAAAAGAR